MEAGEVVTGECVEVLVRTRGDDPRPGSDFQEVTGDNTDHGFSSFETLIRTALALEEDPRDEHSYAYSDKKQAFEGKEKDHCYSSYSKMTHRRVQSLSDENLYRTAQSEFPEDSVLLLPQYQSKDSALDVTGFDTISEKCLSYDNINVKTVDVVTERCIFPGFSDPDISKMTLKNDEQIERPSSVPNSPPSKEQQLTDHSYFKSSLAKKKASIGSRSASNDKVPNQQDVPDGLKDGEKPPDKSCLNKSPLFDHSYDTSQKPKSLPGHTGVKRGRSSEKIDSFDGHHILNTTDLTKSPFLDHSYQSCELKNVGKRLNVGKKLSTGIDKTQVNTETILPKGKQSVTTDDSSSDKKVNEHFSKQHLRDHAYEKVGDLWKRSRSCSLSETTSFRNTGLKTDHSYTVPNDTMCVEDDAGTNDSNLSDSGTESLNEEDEENMLTTFESLDAFHDHSYVTKKTER